MSTIKAWVEIGAQRTFVGALEWPGWCRSGKNEALAAKALLEYRERYARALEAGKVGFLAPGGEVSLVVTERARGSTTTDFGTPGAQFGSDALPLSAAELAHDRLLLQACWLALDRAAQQATGRPLRKGPRGGGRELDEIVAHVLEAEHAYLGRIGWRLPGVPGEEPGWTRQMVLSALEAKTRGELPETGPRGGAFWPARYFVRRVAWHILDHAWEIEDRIM